MIERWPSPLAMENPRWRDPRGVITSPLRWAEPSRWQCDNGASYGSRRFVTTHSAVTVAAGRPDPNRTEPNQTGPLSIAS